MDLLQFLNTVVTTPEGYLYVASGPKPWKQMFYEWPKQTDDVIAAVKQLAPTTNVYFTSHLFSKPQASRAFLLPSRTIAADLDDAIPSDLPLQPSLLVQTSNERHQGYWLLDESLSPDDLEALSRRVTYAIKDCDRSGWPLVHVLRMPYTFNYKYGAPQPILLPYARSNTYNYTTVSALPAEPNANYVAGDTTFIQEPTRALPDIGPQELLERIRPKIPNKVALQYNNVVADRSAALWALMQAAFRAGCTREEVYILALHSANNKFGTLAYNADRELAKDVIRAEAATLARDVDARAVIADARRMNGTPIEKRQYIADVVLRLMKRSGEFVRTRDDLSWYIRNDSGHPLSISQRSEYLNSLLDQQYGLNTVEYDTQAVVAGLISHGRTIPADGISSTLSYYDSTSNAMLLHTGRKDVIRITERDISNILDGQYGVLFPWPTSNEPFTPNYSAATNDWYSALFRDCLDNVIGMPPELALVLLRVWFMFLLFRSAATSRPILALFGQPGAGKSTLFRRIYALLYGRNRSLGAVTSMDDFDHATATEALVVLDNADTFERWLPDRLALSASTSDIIKRKLYTDTDVVVLRRQAMVGITAHNPKFGREDVADRLLLLTFKRLPRFKAEGDILSAIVRQRNELWGGICMDIQRVLQTPMPSHAQAPQFRIEDFARIGHWIATAFGVQQEFATVLGVVQRDQRLFTVEEETTLVDALQLYVRKTRTASPEKAWLPAGKLWEELELLAADGDQFRRKYHNPVYLGKKLWAMQEALGSVFSIEWQYDAVRSAKVWRIRDRDNDTINSTASGGVVNGVYHAGSEEPSSNGESRRDVLHDTSRVDAPN